MSDVSKLVDKCQRVLGDKDTGTEAPDGYSSVPLCAVDAIFSIGVRYGGVENVVNRYKSYWLEKGVDADTDEHSTRGFLDEFAGRDDLAETLFDNRQRTSPRGGILKADAVVQLLEVLDSAGIQTTKQLRDHFDDADLDRAIRNVHGQSSGISAKYLFLLAGVEDAVKPDRMIIRFVSQAVDHKVTALEAQNLVVAASRELRLHNPELTPRVLDHLIWHAQRKS